MRLPHHRGVVDVASRKVLVHRVAITLEAIHATGAIEQASATCGRPEVVNTDQGSKFTDVVMDASCKLGMDGHGTRRDAVFVERLYAVRRIPPSPAHP